MAEVGQEPKFFFKPPSHFFLLSCTASHALSILVSKLSWKQMLGPCQNVCVFLGAKRCVYLCICMCICVPAAGRMEVVCFSGLHIHTLYVITFSAPHPWYNSAAKVQLLETNTCCFHSGFVFYIRLLALTRTHLCK